MIYVKFKVVAVCRDTLIAECDPHDLERAIPPTQYYVPGDTFSTDDAVFKMLIRKDDAVIFEIVHLPTSEKQAVDDTILIHFNRWRFAEGTKWRNCGRDEQGSSIDSKDAK